MIELLFTTSKKTFSKLTRWGLGTDCSHFVIGFDLDKPSGIVFHSDFSGVHIDFYSHFIENNMVVHRLKFNQSLNINEEELVYQAIIEKTYKSNYDYGAYLFWSINIIGNKLLNLPICKKNLWNSKGLFLCTEVYESLSGLWINAQITLPKINLDMLSPCDLYRCLKDQPYFKDSLQNIS